MSVFLEWMNSSLMLDIPEIDDQHRELFKRIDKLLDAMKQGRGCDEIIPLIQFLEDYTVMHFSMEEKYMKTYNYLGFVQHAREHQEFIRKCREAKISFRESGSCSAWVVQFQILLRTWVKEHIARQDMALGKYLKGKMPPA